MNEIIAAKNRGSRSQIDGHPKLGEWYWVKGKEEEANPDAEKREPEVWEPDQSEDDETLMCVTHLGSNFVRFEFNTGDDCGFNESIHNRELLARIRPESNWKAILQKRLERTQQQLQAAIAALADICQRASLLDEGPEAGSLLPALVRQSPEAQKLNLKAIKETDFPAGEARVKKITQYMVGLHKSAFLGQRAQVAHLTKAVAKVDERLFALDLYAGIGEGIVQLVKGQPALPETPIAVRQMLRYMDEECLIDLQDGGMDYRKLEDFDAWVSKPENMRNIVPEPRCLVAIKVRRHQKQYPTPSDIMGWFQLIADHQENEKTYLLIRNGERLYRLWVDLDFNPRLLPLRNAFSRPFEEEIWWERDYKTGKTFKTITPDDLEFDKHAEKRRKEIMHYNRVIFLLQGLLDRSKVFAPHPPINLGSQADANQYFKAVYDEEDGLPSANPPKWEEYRDALNAKIKVGHIVYSAEPDPIYYKHRPYGMNEKPKMVEVTRIHRKSKEVTVSWNYGFRSGYELKDSWGRGYHGEWGQWPIKRKRHLKLPLEEVFNVTDYPPGGYKPFLCDAQLKGRYLEWAPALLLAEKWHLKKGKIDEKD